MVGRQGGGCRREKVEQVDPLGLVLVQGGERGQVDQQQRPASDAEGREDARRPAGQQGDDPGRHAVRAFQAP